MKFVYIKITSCFFVFCLGLYSALACDTCTVNSVILNNTVLTYEGVLYDFPLEGQSTWFYKIDNSDLNGKDCSHINFEVGNCLAPNNLLGGGTYLSKTLPGLNYSGNFSLGKDGSDEPYKMYGIKYDTLIPKGTSTQIFFVLNINLKVSANTIKLKASNQFYKGFICLPSVDCDALPIVLMNFGVSYSNNYPLLRWATASETANDGFEIQHSADGKTFLAIGWVESHHFSYTINKYEFIDRQNTGGYYRLKIIDYDDHNYYSAVVYAFKQKEVMISPNPSISLVVITLGSDKITELQVIDFNGRDVTHLITIRKVESSSEINVSALPKGYYTIILNKLNYGSFIHL